MDPPGGLSIGPVGCETLAYATLCNLVHITQEVYLFIETFVTEDPSTKMDWREIGIMLLILMLLLPTTKILDNNLIINARF